jgi:hypothetical protein
LFVLPGALADGSKRVVASLLFGCYKMSVKPEQLKRARRKRGYNQQQAAARLGVSQA